MINFDDYMDDHQAAKAAIEAEAKARREEEEARRAEEWQRTAQLAAIKRIKERNVRLFGIVAWLPVSRNVKHDIPGGKLFIDGVDVTPDFYMGTTARGNPVITVGSNGTDRTNFPRLKNGSYNWVAIGAKLGSIADRKNAEAKRNAQASANKDLAIQVDRELDLPDYSRLVAPSQEVPGHVVVRLTEVYSKAHTMTPDRAKELLMALRSFGIKLSYKD